MAEQPKTMHKPLRTREQQYAAAVFEKIQVLLAKYPDESNAERKAYGSMAHKLPVLIRTAGLAQALAFLQARHKDGSPQQQLLSDLASVMQQRNLVEQSRLASLAEYTRLTQEALQALLWFKRFAQSELKVDASDDAEEL